MSKIVPVNYSLTNATEGGIDIAVSFCAKRPYVRGRVKNWMSRPCVRASVRPFVRPDF